MLSYLTTSLVSIYVEVFEQCLVLNVTPACSWAMYVLCRIELVQDFDFRFRVQANLQLWQPIFGGSVYNLGRIDVWKKSQDAFSISAVVKFVCSTLVWLPKEVYRRGV